MSDVYQFRMECEGCRERAFVVTYDANVPMRIISFECVCGHTTEIKRAPGLLARAFNDAGQRIANDALRRLGDDGGAAQ